MRTKFAERWYARSNRAGDHMCHHQAKWDQPPLVPPIDKEGRQVHVRRVGKDGGKGGMERVRGRGKKGDCRGGGEGGT